MCGTIVNHIIYLTLHIYQVLKSEIRYKHRLNYKTRMRNVILTNRDLVHLVFHANGLRTTIKNLVSMDTLAEYFEPLSIPHVPKKFLGF